VERYAVTFMENELAPLTTEELEKAEVCDVLPKVPQSKPYTCTIACGFIV